jgi:hypothetical protein
MCDEVGMTKLYLCALAVAGLVGCRPTTQPSIDAHVLHVPLEGPCPIGELEGEWRQGQGVLKAVVTAPYLDEPMYGEGTAPIVIEDIALRDNEPVTVALYLVGTDGPTWRGVAPSVTIAPTSEPTPVNIALAKIGDLSCARTPTNEGLAMHEATPLLDGTILLTGGARLIEEVASVVRYTATDSAYIYDPATATVTLIDSQMQAARMFHTAARLGDGRVVIAGGASAVVGNRQAQGGFPFAAEMGQIVQTIEVYDPSTKTFSSVGNDPSPNGGRMFAAAVATPSGGVLITGGSNSIYQAGQPETLSSARNDTTLCAGDPVSCGAGPLMTSRRAGHIAELLDVPSGALLPYLFGGSIDGASFELLVEGESTFRSADVDDSNPTLRNVFFATSATYIGYRVLVVGGLRRSAAGVFTMATLDVAGADKGAAYLFDATSCSDNNMGDRNGCVVTTPPNGTPMHIGAPSFLGGASVLQDELRVFVAGGYSSLALEPSNRIDMFIEADSLTAPSRLEFIDLQRTLREPRAGLTLTGLVDGTLVIVGGEIPFGGVRAPARTIEVYADVKAPVGAGVPQ